MAHVLGGRYRKDVRDIAAKTRETERGEDAGDRKRDPGRQALSLWPLTAWKDHERPHMC